MEILNVDMGLLKNAARLELMRKHNKKLEKAILQIGEIVNSGSLADTKLKEINKIVNKMKEII